MRRLLAAVVFLALVEPAGAVERDAAYAHLRAILAAEQVPTGWTGSTGGCVRGTESAASIQATADTVNALRDYAGLGAVTFDAALNDKALAGALMMDAADSLSHDPGPAWPCATPEGQEAAGHSNLFLGLTGAKAMVGFVDDSGVESLGHRRWVLDPRATVFGTGSTAEANALWVVGGGPASVDPGPELVSWPPPGWLPWTLVFPDWSASFNVPADTSAAAVAVTVDGEPRTVGNVRTLDPGFGTADPTLAWNVALEPGDDGADREVVVTITGATAQPVTWTTHAFAVKAPRIGRVRYARKARRVAAVADIQYAQSVSYEWLRAGKVVGRKRTFRARRPDRLRCRVTATGLETVSRLGPRLRVPRRG